ncbi:OB-fold domain-containing protein [Streptomyces sp. NA02950]|uniref:bifunctional MaoC family dehydratase N-terminal/OB-fold nucleic acid binding domain-containing protein n=1 Tax=Streptomyces sp. NA02950 TaxID=2742137 RepID=UPI001590889B|nr:bifunctional MaoC family dehydratase N-terminal/OB-fold nucleic acid binding domain-containing protein [Streptomyces sp. NA02950]QKV93912.1 OB-fold domain-containing protein [Streptomyces sp. NA02950]
MTGERTPGKPVPDELYQRLRAFEGRTAVQGGEGRDPVNEPMIRHWCEAMGDASPAYPDIAPPTMLQAWTMGGLAGHPAGSTRTRAYDELFALLDDAGCTSIVATDCEQEYLRPLRPGDRVRFDAVIESVSPRKATALGSGHFVTTRMDIHVGGELVGTHRFRVLKYAPARRGGKAKPNPKPEPNPEAKPEAKAKPVHPEPAAEAARPRPVVNRDNAGFWEGVAAHRLLLQRCTACGTLRFPWLPGCGRCGSPEWETAEASGRGTVFSHVVMHHPPFPAFDPPYAVGLVELAEGVRMVSGITGVPYGKVSIGMPVELEFLRVDDAKGAMELPVFRATAEEAG